MNNLKRITKRRGRCPLHVQWMLLWRFALAVVFIAIVGAGSAAASAPWAWKVTGVLGSGEECGTRAVSSSDYACAYSVSNPPDSVKKVMLRVTAKNSSGTLTCFGLSVSTSYSAGLESFCVKPHATGTYRSSGSASHYRQLSVSVFVTSGSKDRPIAPENSKRSSDFSISVSADI
jgi:hypothetical protein